MIDLFMKNAQDAPKPITAPVVAVMFIIASERIYKVFHIITPL